MTFVFVIACFLAGALGGFLVSSIAACSQTRDEEQDKIE